MRCYDTSAFAFSRARVREFGDDWGREQRPVGADAVAGQLLLGSLRSAFEGCTLAHSPHPELNDRIARSMLATLPAQLFDSTGVLKSLWLWRLEQITSDSQGMVEELLCAEWPGARRFLCG
jgi:hypothetical protein